MNVEKTMNEIMISIGTSNRKCIVLNVSDYIEVVKYFKNLLLKNQPSVENKNILTYGGINIYLDEDAILSFIMDEKMYLELKRIKTSTYIIEPSELIVHEYGGKFTQLIKSRIYY